jgi:hypothetical protein
MVFLLLSIDGHAISSEYALAAGTPLMLGITVYEAVLMVRALCQRLGISRTRRQLHRQRQGMP